MKSQTKGVNLWQYVTGTTTACIGWSTMLGVWEWSWCRMRLKCQPDCPWDWPCTPGLQLASWCRFIWQRIKWIPRKGQPSEAMRRRQCFRLSSWLRPSGKNRPSTISTYLPRQLVVEIRWKEVEQKLPNQWEVKKRKQEAATELLPPDPYSMSGA